MKKADDFHNRGLQLRQETDVPIFAYFSSISPLHRTSRREKILDSPNKSGNQGQVMPHLDWEA